MNKAEIAPKKEMELAKTPPAENAFPMFVEAEKMFDRFAKLTNEITHKAYEFFVKRGGTLGRELDDWFKAEAEILRPVTVEITENDKTINVNALLPGFKPDEIEISVDGKMLILTGETKMETKKEDDKTFYSEWRSNRFFRRLPLPAEVEADKVKANLKDGVLTLKMPKAAPMEAKKIMIAAG